MRKTLPQVSQELLKVLKKDRRRFYSARELSTYFDLSPYAVHQAADELKDWGYDIEDKKKKSYRLKNLPGVFARRRRPLQTLPLRKLQLECFDQGLREAVASQGNRARPERLAGESRFVEIWQCASTRCATWG